MNRLFILLLLFFFQKASSQPDNGRHVLLSHDGVGAGKFAKQLDVETVVPSYSCTKAVYRGYIRSYRRQEIKIYKE